MGFDHAVMAAVQSLYQVGGGFFDAIFLGLTALGEEALSLLLVFLIYWCLDKRMGGYLIFSVYPAIAANGVVKDLVRRPRPFLNPDYADLRYVKVDTLLVNTADLSSSFSFPSGHSQTAASLYGALAFWKKKPWVTVCCGLLVLGVMTSRVYLGVHYPTDVLAGAALGLLIAWVAWKLYDRFYEKRLLMMTVAVGLSCFALLVDFSADTFKTIGLGVGALAGIALDQKTLNFKTDGTALRKVFRLLLGFALIVALRLGLKAALPTGMGWDGLRYAVIGFAAMYLWPLIFTKTGL